MTFKPASVNCFVCGKEIAVDDIKYHTSKRLSPVKVFCGPECSNKYYLDNGKQI